MKQSLLVDFYNPKQVAVLIDPEKSQDESRLMDLIVKMNSAKIDYIFVGGSTVTKTEFEFTVSLLKSFAQAPIVIFPGSGEQISSKADGILYLSLLSGRNPDFLIGHHVQSAQEIVESKLEVIPTAYLLIDGGTHSSVAYVSQTTPIPRNKISIAKNTALAGKLQGKKVCFLDAGSGAMMHVPEKMVSELSSLEIPIIVGGGITSIDTISNLHSAGASIVVIGNKIESEIDFLLDLKLYINNRNNTHHPQKSNSNGIN